ncbi:MAG TPA: hypothetical protein VE623_04580 [Acidimicrobiales bacterium]|nr:hypothetical protein [Acidimicrobiales bacterium]
MRRAAALAVVLLFLATTMACSRPAGPVGAGGGSAVGGGDRADQLGSGNGYVDRRVWRARQDEYLRFATEQLDRTSLANVLAHFTRAERDRRFRFDPASVGPDDFTATFAKIDTHTDTSDFDMMRLVALWYGHRRDLRPDLRAAIERRFNGFRYWYTDPLPAGIVDNKWFWSENHRIIFHALEYLAGRALPRETFAITSETGRTHAERGRRRIEAWLDEKARWGFSEWHSDVYYGEDVEALLLLTEVGEPDLAERAAAMLDVFLYDLAIHQVQGNVGVTHGRSYMKDKSRAADQDVFGTVKLAFGTSDQPYPSRSDATATALAAADRYRLPAVIERVARSPETIVDREHMGVPLDVDAVFTADPTSPVPGTSFTDPETVPFWWERGALTAWQVVPLTLATIERHDLWETALFQPFRALADASGGDPRVAAQLAHALRCQINVGLLRDVDTITWRSPHAMLSTAQDYRPGCFGWQYHAWQATLDEDAVVFTTNPGNEPRPGDRWVDADLYWSGAATMPRSAQHGAAVINMYAPQYPAPTGPPLDAFGYLPYTHAYFPTERFDEVRHVDAAGGGWTFGRRGNGYVGLWSWRPTEWRTHDPALTFTNGLTEPFDLVAPGGANNVWIAEVGDAQGWGSFDEFVAAVSAARIDVRDLGTGGGVSRGFDVSYASPSEGTLAFSWTGPLTVEGTEVPLHGGERFGNPFGTTRFGDTTIEISDGPARLTVDLVRGERRAELRHDR